MGFYIGKQVVKRILSKGKNIMDAKILVMGTTFKEDVTDIRNSKVVDVVRELESFSCKVDVVDPHANSGEVYHEYGYHVLSKPEGQYDGIIVAVNHKDYLDLNEDYFLSLMTDDKGVFFDIKGIYKGKIKHIDYMSL